MGTCDISTVLIAGLLIIQGMAFQVVHSILWCHKQLELCFRILFIETNSHQQYLNFMRDFKQKKNNLQ